MKLLSQESAPLSKGGILAGDVAFKLYDTYGFPLDLTQDILRGEEKTVDTQGFDSCMARQKAEARSHWVGSGAAVNESLWFELQEKHGVTDFLGYNTLSAQGALQDLIIEGKIVAQALKDQEIDFIVNQTPFYAESGGQMADMGTAETLEGAYLEILGVSKKAEGLFVHRARVVAGTVRTGQALVLKVDDERRTRIRANHSATHLLHRALRRHLGEQVTQKGSLVAPDRLRFDFSYNEPLTPQQILTLEEEVNGVIRINTPVATRLLSTQAALETGAVALFGEKYGQEVRVVSMGAQDDHAHDNPYSVEFCGGTHVSHTGDIGFFKIISQTSVAAGIRRIEAVTGAGAQAYVQEKLSLLDSVGARLKSPAEQVLERLESVLEERKRLEKEVKDLKRQLASSSQGGSSKEEAALQVCGVNLVTRVLREIPAKDLKGIADGLRQQNPQGVIALLGIYEGKASLVVSIDADLSQKLSAVDLVRASLEALEGKGGGGRPDLAQAGGTNVDNPQKVLEALEKALEKALS